MHYLHDCLHQVVHHVFPPPRINVKAFTKRFQESTVLRLEMFSILGELVRRGFGALTLTLTLFLNHSLKNSSLGLSQRFVRLMAHFVRGSQPLLVEVLDLLPNLRS